MTRGWLGAKSQFDMGDENDDADVVMFASLRCGGEVWQPLNAKKVCQQCGGQLVANPRRG